MSYNKYYATLCSKLPEVSPLPHPTGIIDVMVAAELTPKIVPPPKNDFQKFFPEQKTADHSRLWMINIKNDSYCWNSQRLERTALTPPNNPSKF